MATLPSPRTWTVGELLTAAKLNLDLRDGLNFLLSPPLAVLRKSGNQSIPQSASTEVTWDVEDIDRDGGHSTVSNTSRYTSQTAGWYNFSTVIGWDVAATDRVLSFASTTSPSDVQVDRRNGSDSTMNGQAAIFLGVGDYTVVSVIRFSASAQAVASLYSRFEARWASK
ncbi:hypothetical protein ACFWYW_55905 [Nonomuraea sp. NPDC059023]|uniref:hypothetical protein n=1 Tax=unclassified Nonomuraea TaxID=2593643 RepID=UPI0036CB2D73